MHRVYLLRYIIDLLQTVSLYFSCLDQLFVCIPDGHQRDVSFRFNYTSFFSDIFCISKRSFSYYQYKSITVMYRKEKKILQQNMTRPHGVALSLVMVIIVVVVVVVVVVIVIVIVIVIVVVMKDCNLL